MSDMERHSCDILISGGGIAGMMAAALMARAGFSTLCVDPAPPVTDAGAKGADLRTTAFLQPAKALLDSAGIWDALADQATPLQVMQIADCDPATHQLRATRAFDAADISDQPFGWNLSNWHLRAVMVADLAARPNTRFRPGVAVDRVLLRDSGARATLSDGTRVDARLLIGADGRNSMVRTAAGIGVKTIRYGQKALVFAVTHAAPHRNTSTEVHQSGGPFTLVPLPDLDGKHRSAVVWMDAGPPTQARMDLDAAAFSKAAMALS